MAGPTLSRRGLMLVLSSPSGAGKSVIARAILDGDKQVTLSVSVTTRPKRPGEVDGGDYTFIDADSFARMVGRGDLLEHATVFGNAYGTPRGPVEEAPSKAGGSKYRPSGGRSSMYSSASSA